MADIQFYETENDDGSDSDDGQSLGTDGYDMDPSNPEFASSQLQRLEKYMLCENSYTRQMMAKSLTETLVYLKEPSDIEKILNAMELLTSDQDSLVRAEVVEQFVGIFHHLQTIKHTLPFNPTTNYFLPTFIKTIQDCNIQVRKVSQNSLLCLVQDKFISPAEVESMIVPTLLDLSVPDGMEEFKTEAIVLMTKLAPMVGAEITERHFLEVFLEVCSDRQFHVRKVCATNFGDLCVVLGQEITENKLLPRFIELCHDEIWGIRNACTDCFMQVAKTCSMQIRHNKLAPIFLSLLNDQSKWVRMAAFQSLGGFISTFADPKKTGLTLSSEGVIHYKEPEGVRISSIEDHYKCLQNNVTKKHREKEGTKEDDNKEYNDFNFWKTSFDKLHLNDISGICSLAMDTNEIDIELDEGVGDSTPQVRDITSDNSHKESPTQNDVKDEEEAMEIDLPSSLSQLDPTSLPNPPNQPPEHQSNSIDSTTEATTDPILPSTLTSNIMKTINDFFNSPTPSESTYESLINDQPFNTASSPVTSDKPLTEAATSNKTVLLNKNNRIAYSPNSMSDSLSPVGGRSSDEAGPFDHISCQQNIVPVELLQQYLSMADSSRVETVDAEILKHCAYSFPAVTFTLGRHNWPLLKPLFEHLSRDMQWKVRRTLSFSIHEIAVIVGSQIATTDLLPIFCEFLKDLDEVRVGVLKHLADFLRLLDMDVRRQYLVKVADFLTIDNQCNWRFRVGLAEQLIELFELFSTQDVVEHLSSVAISLAEDSVSRVRIVSIKVLEALIKKLYNSRSQPHTTTTTTTQSSENISQNHEAYWVDMVKTLTTRLSQSKCFSRRQIFAKLCTNLLEHGVVQNQHFQQFFLPSLISLASDPVPNVRLFVARCYFVFMLHDAYFMMPGSAFEESVLELSKDTDKDIREVIDTHAPQYRLSPPLTRKSIDKQLYMKLEEHTGPEPVNYKDAFNNEKWSDQIETTGDDSATDSAANATSNTSTDSSPHFPLHSYDRIVIGSADTSVDEGSIEKPQPKSSAEPTSSPLTDESSIDKPQDFSHAINNPFIMTANVSSVTASIVTTDSPHATITTPHNTAPHTITTSHNTTSPTSI